MAKTTNIIVRVLSSYGLSCAVLVLLFVLTWLGTLEQRHTGLYLAQKQYFDSFFLLANLPIEPPGIPAFDLVVPMPGGQTLMGLLALNLLVGGLVRLRKSKRTVGIFITHVGIAVMLAAGFVKYYHADDGHLDLYEGERCDEFESYHEWEIAITRDLGDGRFREYLIPGEDFIDLELDEQRYFDNPDLPFRLELHHFMPNSEPKLADGSARGLPVVDGFYLSPRPMANEHEANLAGAYMTAVERDGGARHAGLLWGAAMRAGTTTSNPFVFDVGDTTWAVDLRHRRFPLPFVIHLDDFQTDFHPRTGIPSNYQSDVTLIEGDSVRPVTIKMNEPLRLGGYTLFQSSFGPQPYRDGVHMWSVFSVTRNPSDHWPLISCIIIALGLLIHFLMRLHRYIRSQTRTP